jgi:uracil-DNA glycosylase
MSVYTKKNVASLIGEVGNYLRFLAETGCPGFDCSTQSLEILKSWGQKSSPALRGPEPKHVKAAQDHRSQSLAYRQKSDFYTPENALTAVRTELGNCRRCPLSQNRLHLVFGEGNPQAKLVFVGDKPGIEEDRSGKPFLGEAGQLLTKIIEAGMKLSRNQVYICDAVKCRPPADRRSKPDEINACLPFFNQQMAAIKPDFICVLGETAAQILLKTDLPISQLRGQFYDYMGIKLMPTFHPADLLRNPEKKRAVWEDVKKLMK